MALFWYNIIEIKIYQFVDERYIVVYEFEYDGIKSWGYTEYEVKKQNCYYFVNNSIEEKKDFLNNTKEITYNWKDKGYKVKINMFGDIELEVNDKKW
ncbi:MAG: hypothetical protein ACLFMO_02715 [Eubacteriales bacterium]